MFGAARGVGSSYLVNLRRQSRNSRNSRDSWPPGPPPHLPPGQFLSPGGAGGDFAYEEDGDGGDVRARIFLRGEEKKAVLVWLGGKEKLIKKKVRSKAKMENCS